MTFYLKYRPQTFRELDLTEVREQLSSMMASGRLPHAFLFSGPRGLGKTSAARILAKVINCLARGASQIAHGSKKKTTSHKPRATSQIEPCNKCDVCVSITNGSAMDLIEIDAASNRGIDDIRALREKIKTSPVILSKKVYVIDEVHMLTKEAFNALLKTLEEPPVHAFFILATTEPHKLPETIISRCTHIKFRKATADELVRSLKRVVLGEKLKLEKGLLLEIAKNVDGSFRDAAKVLEQLSFLNKKITKKDLQNLRVSKEKHQFLGALKEKDAVRALKWIEKASEEGVDWKDFLIEFLQELRKALLTKFAVGDSEITDFSLEELKRLVRLFSQAAVELKTALVAELPIELAAIDFCENNSKLQMKNAKLKFQIQNSNKKSKTFKQPTISYARRQTSNQQSAINNKKSQTSDPAADLLEIQNKWSDVLRHVKPQNHSVEALLRSARPKDVQGKSVIIEVFYEFHKGRLETENCRLIVENSFQKVLNNRSLKISYVLGEKKQQKISDKRYGIVGKDEKEREGDGELVRNVEEIFSPVKIS